MKNILLAGAVALAPVAATAAPVIYTGYDVGAGDLASAPLAQAASDAFDAALGGGASLTDFEAGPSTDFTIVGGNRTNTPNCPPSLCGFNTTAGGQYFHEVFGESITITFSSAISAFGAYFGGWQIGTQTITYENGDTVTLDMGDGGGGGLRFFGFIDAGASIASITYDSVNDIVSMDDVRIGNPAPIPLPAALPMLTAGLLGLGLMRRRRKQA